MQDERFVRCPCCETWFSQDEVLTSPEIQPIGMMLEDTDPRWNFFVFNHAVAGCGSTFAMSVDLFRACITDPVPEVICTGTTDCERHCTMLGDLEICRVNCHWAPYRRLLQQMLATRRANAPSPATIPPSEA